MKKVFYIISLTILGLFLTQCEKEYDDMVTENAKVGGLVDVSGTAFNYVVGDGATYTFDLYLNQNPDAVIKKVNIYKSFFSVATPWGNPDDTTHTTPDSIPAMWAKEEVLQESFDITDNSSHWISFTGLDYAGLIANLEVNGAALPASDGELKIGDYFNFIVESELDNGDVVKQAYNVKMTVSTRFAGTYKFIEGVYYRLGVLSSAGDYWFDTYQIESIDAKTYKMIGMCAWMDNVLYFQIDDDGVITYPEEWDGAAQILNDQPLITCESNSADMVNVNCGNTNFVIKDDENGKDRLIMSFGYYTSGSGPREFYQVLEKI
ncbi:MAG: hypothetical protein U9R19_02140 [Bacteroidota bacterium]|nr:hypothetical protein [Bacteroidota bacterium]